MPAPFLTARWENLILYTFAVEPERLLPWMPDGCVPDTINGQAFVSLVAFEFKETRVKGFRIPYHTYFPEVNLRIYVRHGERRGVTFVRELVPKQAVSLVANLLYNERYATTRMNADCLEDEEGLQLYHTFYHELFRYDLYVETGKEAFFPEEGGLEDFFKEHEWGFGSDRAGRTTLYRVEHPRWRLFPVRHQIYSVDFGTLYGEEWAFLNNQEPYHIMVAEGSEVSVYPAGRL